MQAPSSISREDLYQRVWAVPIRVVAEELSLAYDEVVALCKKLGVPRPWSGYWKQVEAGTAAPATPLAEPKWGQDRPHRLVSRKLEASREAAAAASEIAALGQLKVPTRLSRPHPIISSWLKKPNAQRTRAHGHVLAPSLSKVSATDERRYRILNTLIVALERCGARFEVVPDEAPLIALFGRTAVEFRLREMLRQAWIPYTPEELEWPWNQRRPRGKLQLQPTGVLRLELQGGPSWTDGQTIRVEDRVLEIVTAVVVARDRAVESAERSKQEEAERLERQRRREEQVRHLALEGKRWDVLVQLSRQSTEADQVRRFIARLRQSRSEAEITSGHATAEIWLAWMEKKLNELDPLAGDLDQVFSRLEAVS